MHSKHTQKQLQRDQNRSTIGDERLITGGPASGSSERPTPAPSPPGSYTTTTTVVGGRSFIPPSSPFARAVVMGNEASSEVIGRDDRALRSGSQTGTPTSSKNLSSTQQQQQAQQQRPVSNLTVLLNQHNQQQQQQQQVVDASAVHQQSILQQKSQSEADSASGPPPNNTGMRFLGSSAPSHLTQQQPRRIFTTTGANDTATQSSLFFIPPAAQQQQHIQQPSYFTSVGAANPGASKSSNALSRQYSTEVVPTGSGSSSTKSSDRVRRCMSSKELGTIAPPSGSPYAYMLYKKEQLEMSMRQRLRAMREADPPERHASDNESSSTSSRLREGSNQMRNLRRAQHNEAIVKDLCNVVADLFIAESKLLKPFQYGVVPITDDDHGDGTTPDEVAPKLQQQYVREHVVQSIHNFVAALPTRYALSADTPSEVLLHMRIMAAARADKTKVVVHIHNVDEHGLSTFPAASNAKNVKQLRLVTICCNDAIGLLEYISKLLATGGSRVVDADVMLSTDGIVLDRFLVEMNGRLRMDRLADRLEAFLKEQQQQSEGNKDSSSDDLKIGASSSASSPCSTEPGGPLYYQAEPKSDTPTPRNIQEEMQSAIPLSQVLASRTDMAGVPSFPKLRKFHSMPPTTLMPPSVDGVPAVRLAMRSEPKEGGSGVSIPTSSVPSKHSDMAGEAYSRDSCEVMVPIAPPSSTRQRRPLVNRKASSNLDEFDSSNPQQQPLDYVTIPYLDSDAYSGENRVIPLIPFDELMLIETLGTGRVSTIYRAAWQRASYGVHMVALKVAMINNITGDTSHVDELRREADIAARLSHPNICDLVGVAADQECFCLAYDYCEGGSLLSLLSDPRRYYEYLPIALDIANAMAYLHSKNLIHRDLKPSNILLTRDHRAKIADFGMSVAYTGQELTAETGTYRYMAPEVIRHESYSSNADVYSFGICLWQLITREVPFATMTPIQAAYAVAEGRRPTIPPSTPRRLQEIIQACWDQDSHKRPSFTYIAMALADYARMAFSPANVGALTLQIANEMLESVEGNSNVNVDFSTPVAFEGLPPFLTFASRRGSEHGSHHSHGSNVGLEIE